MRNKNVSIFCHCCCDTINFFWQLPEPKDSTYRMTRPKSDKKCIILFGTNDPILLRFLLKMNREFSNRDTKVHNDIDIVRDAPQDIDKNLHKIQSS